MDKISTLTIFPEIISAYCNTSILKRAQAKKLVSFECIDIRQFADNKAKTVDDYSFGGGGGMVMQIAPIHQALLKIDPNHQAHRVLLTPRGATLTLQHLQTWQQQTHLVLIAGHYEGIDERINHYVDESISIGDFVLTGGELPALIIIDALTRLIPNVITPGSLVNESFQQGLLDFPVYTRPAKYQQYSVPEVLLSGNHKDINTWRLEQRRLDTLKLRPDLWQKYESQFSLSKPQASKPQTPKAKKTK